MAEHKPINLWDRNQKLVVLHETTLQSWLKDVWTFGCIAGLAWFNHQFLAGSWVLDLFAVVAVCLKGIGNSTGHHTTVAELQEMLRKGDRYGCR